MKKIILAVICFIFVISLASAYFPRQNIDSQLKQGKSISTAASEYPAVQINDWFNIGSTLADLVLTDHTSTCSDNCYSIMDISTTTDSALIDDVKFYTIQDDGSEIEQPIRSYQFYIQNGTDNIEVPDYEWQCSNDGASVNGTAVQTCSDVQTGTHTEDTPVWIPYSVGQALPAGDYNIKLEGQKRPDRTVDWVITSQGQDINDLAIWAAGNNTISKSASIVYADHGDWSFLGNANDSNFSSLSTAGSISQTSNLFLNWTIPNLMYNSALLTCKYGSNNGGLGTGFTIYNYTNPLNSYSESTAGAIVTETFNLTSQNGLLGTGGIAISFNHAGVATYTSSVYECQLNATLNESTLNINYPSDNYYSNNSNVNFNATVSSIPVNIYNISFYDNSTGIFKLNQTKQFGCWLGYGCL
jgi:hypothetical protein